MIYILNKNKTRVIFVQVLIYISNKNKTRVIFVQVVLESWAAMPGCKWLVQYIKLTTSF